MNTSPLIRADELKARLAAATADTLVFDCSYELMRPEAGRSIYESVHVRGARWIDLGHDLSAEPPAHSACGGRHPLPTREDFAQRMGQWGISNTSVVVVYDRNGANYCGRLWWMLKWAGLQQAYVLDGGLQAWQAAGGAVESGAGPAPRTPAHFVLGEPLVRLVLADEVLSALGRPQQTLIDARAAARYRGEVEPLDPVAGHIPGALNRAFGDNIDAQGLFKPAEQLRREFTALLGSRDPSSVVHHCGSGVSAVPNLIAMAVAGLGTTGLFAGSWSEWCADPARPVARG